MRLQLKHEEGDILEHGHQLERGAKFFGSRELLPSAEPTPGDFRWGAVWGKAAWLTHRMIPMNVTNEITTRLTSDAC